MSSSFEDSTRGSATTSGQATIGSSIVIKGEITGSEDLVIEGTVEGSVLLQENTVTVGASAKVSANVTARKIRVQGEVCGDLYGKEVVVVESSGKVLGNITSPRLSLEEGARLKGAIDTDPGAGDGRVAVSMISEKREIPMRKDRAGTSIAEVDTKSKTGGVTRTEQELPASNR